jgi:general secretion pathway protein H
MTLPRDRRRDRGFTLLELLIVLAILSLVVALALPLYGRRTGVASLAGATQQVRAALAAARSAAIADDRDIAFAGGVDSYSVDGRRYPFATAAAVTIEVQGGARIAFYPSGGASGGRVILRQAARHRELEIEALTGRAVLLP